MQSRSTQNSQGIDISKYQGDISWDRVKKAGISFVIIKCTEGSTGIDPMFSKNIINAKNAGLKVGVYHFSRANDNQSAIAEAQHFITVMNQNGGFSVLDIAPAFDIETKEGSTKAVVSNICKTWIEYIKKASNMQPLIYSYPSFADEFLDNSLGEYPLWLATYGGQPSNHSGWNTWTFLQYSESGRIDGIDSPVDLNEYNGNIEDYTYYTEEDLQMINELKAQVQALTIEVQKLKEYNSMSSIPVWAAEAISKAVSEGIMNDPNNRSYDLYSIITILHRKGLI